jgi:uncharacterized protein YciI
VSTAHEPSEVKRTLFIGLYSPGPAWVKEKSIFEQPFLDAHAAFMSKLESDGQLLIGGAFGGKPGGVAIFSFESQAVARRLLLADPVVENNVFVVDIRPFIPTAYGCIKPQPAKRPQEED